MEISGVCFLVTHGAGVQELQVEYEVVELHPQVAADARVEAARRQVGTVHKVGVVFFFWKFGWELLDQDSTSLGIFFNGNGQLMQSHA